FLAEQPQLPPLPPATRHGARASIQGVPLPATAVEICAARVHAYAKVHEGVALLADPFWHLCEIDHVEIKERVRAQKPDYIAPCQPETLRTGPSREILGQQGCIVIAELRSQPSQPSNWAGRVDCELENEENLAIGFGSDHDRGSGSTRAANM